MEVNECVIHFSFIHMLTTCKVRISKMKVMPRHFQIKVKYANERQKFSLRCLPSDEIIKITDGS